MDDIKPPAPRIRPGAQPLSQPLDITKPRVSTPKAATPPTTPASSVLPAGPQELLLEPSHEPLLEASYPPVGSRPKKPHTPWSRAKKISMSLIIIVVILLAAFAGYTYAWPYFTKSHSSQPVAQTTTEAIQQAASALSSNATNQTSAINSSADSLATANSQAATNVGNSIDENSF